MKTMQVTSSSDIVAYGRKARVHFITISNNGTAGTAGEVELREAVATPGDGGTLRWSTRFASGDETSAHFEFGGGNPPGIEFEDGIRLTMDSVTNVLITIGWE